MALSREADEFEARPIGVVRSVLTGVTVTPRQPDEGAPPAVIEVRPEFAAALAGLIPGDRIVVVTWLHQASREELTVHPRGDLSREAVGVFATRSPGRPNPIGLHETVLVETAGTQLHVASLEAFDLTPVLDIKPCLGAVETR